MKTKSNHSAKHRENISASRGFPGCSVVQNLLVNAGDTGDASWIPGSGRSPLGGNGNPLQYSCLRNHTEEPDGLYSWSHKK